MVGDKVILSPTGKFWSVTILVVAETLAMALWFSSSAVLNDMASEITISGVRKAMLASAVQLGFTIGAVIYALLGLADRYDPRKVFALSTGLAALANAVLLVVAVGSGVSILARFITGIMLAGVYPVGMKIAVGWGVKDRGLLVGLLVGALTLGSATPHLLSFLGGADWRLTVSLASLFAALGGGLILFSKLGPYHAKPTRFDWRAVGLAWHDRRIRLSYLGYLGHMWELYAFWAWIGVALALSFSAQMSEPDALALAKITAFVAIGIGAVACVIAGLYADRIGKAKITIIAMAGSGLAALMAAFAFGGPPWIMIVFVVIWGAMVIADSAQFSALVADYAPPERVGALLTFQTALGFGLTVMTVQLTPPLAKIISWPGLFIVLAAGPLVGIIAMVRLRHITKEN